MKSHGFLIICAISCLVPACKNNPTSPPTLKPTFALSAVPDIGTIHTTFRFTAVIQLNGDTVRTGGHSVRWDWDGDGTFETPWLDSLQASYHYGLLGTKTPRIQVRSPDGAIDTASARVFVQELIRITTNETNFLQGNIDWSRDGTNRIAFSWSFGSEWRRIWFVEYPDGTPQAVTSDSDTEIGTFNDFPEWSPNGERISFTTTYDLLVFDLFTRSSTCLGRAASDRKSWSPDGRYIVSGDSIYDLTLKSVSGFPFSAKSFCWSPEGDRIAAGEGSYNGKLSIIAFPALNVLTEHAIAFCGEKIDWSPNGDFIALGFQDSIRAHVLQYNTGRVIALSIDGLTSCWWPSWSEDGTLLAFEAREVGSNRKHEIWAIRFPSDLE